MNKDEILERSRREQYDEGMEQAKKNGQHIGVLVFLALEIVIILFNLFTGQSNYVAFVLLWGFLAAESYPLYRFTEQRQYLVQTVAGSIAAVCFLICHVINVLRLP